MGITDIFKTKQFKSEAERLAAENAYLNSILRPELMEPANLQREILQLNQQLEQLKTDYENLMQKSSALDTEIQQKKDALIILDDELLYQDFSLYTPVYNLMNSEAYKDKLQVVREQQKTMIKNNTAAYFPKNFTYNGSPAQGKKLVADNVKQILRAFNNECEAIIDKVKFNNVEAIRKRIIKSCDTLNKLNSKMQISIAPSYLDLKLQEMNLCYEYSLKKQEEKEEMKRIRAEQREAQKLQKEIEDARKNSTKEKAHYTNALKRIEEQLLHAPDSEIPLLEAKQLEIKNQISAIEEELRQLDYREANQRAGYVYIISNIGSFGENIYKIGMTRRLEPMDRVDELGDASVPFKFDVHAMIFSDDAPSLEAALHRAFDDKKVNMVNTRREFFHVTLDEIEEVVRKNFDKTVEFTRIPRADQFRESQMIRRGLGQNELLYENPISQDYHSKQPAVSNSLPPNSLDPSKEYLYTKWGTYEMPEPYRIKLTYGPRNGKSL